MSWHRRLLGGWFGRLILPGIILQSVLIGGGYATGREIVAYGARFGARGWPAVLAIFAGFTLVAAVTFELARIAGAYDYKQFMRQLIGRAWPAFDLLYGAMVILVIAVMVSAAVNIMGRTLGVPGAGAAAVIVAAVAVLSYRGARAIESFKSVGTVLLYGAYLFFAVLVLGEAGGEVLDLLVGAGEGGGVLSEGGAGAGPEGADSAPDHAEGLPAAGVAGSVPTVLEVVGSGILYVGYNLGVFPAVLFTLRRQESRRDALVAAPVAGLFMTVPFGLTYLCLLAFYPSPEVFEAPVPWLPMLESVGGPVVVVIFGVVMGWTLLETSVGMIHALLDRIHEDLKRRRGPGEGGLTRLQSGALGAGILLAAAALSAVGIVALVGTGYAVMGYLFIALFALPLLTVGLWRILRAKG